MKKIGLIINPISGMGGSVGLKGTDGDLIHEAVKLGATPVSPKRVIQLLSNVKKKDEILFIVPPNKMGEDVIKNEGFKYEVIGQISETTSAEDTKKMAKLMLDKNIDLIIFCGGDGTARDMYDAIGTEKPVIALPAGVKMFSPVFVINPRAGAELLEAFLQGTEMDEKEVLDINEESYRKGKLDSRLYGYLKVPKIQRLLQAGKQSSGRGKTIEENKEEIAMHVVEQMKDDTLYLLGPGTTVKAISDFLCLSKALLGIDAISNKELIGTDLNEKGILNLLKKHKRVVIIVSPIGGQGFIFGRGNKQFTPEVIKKVGKENIRVVATEDKIRNLNCLRVDTGDTDIDELLKGFIKVLTGYKEEVIIDVEC